MHPDAATRSARLDTLTDGVMAIVMTLLVLDLRLPEDIGATDSAGVWHVLHTMRGQLTSYLFSFVVTGLLWLSHVQRSRSARTVDGIHICLSFAFLAAVTLIPFTTALLSRNRSAAATAVYAGVMALASLVLGVMAVRAEAGRPAQRGVVTRAATASRFGVAAVFLLSIPMAAWSVPAARLSWLLVVLISLLPRRRREA